MKKDKKSVLEELYEDCLENRKDLNKKIQDNLNKIDEIDVFLKSIEDTEESDYKVFSPRSIKNKNRVQIEDYQKLNKQINNENHFYYLKLKKLNRQIDSLKVFLTEDNNSDKHLKILDVQEKERSRIARELHDSSLQNLTHLVHMIELSSMYIDQDPIRAKLELVSCSKNLKQIINEIRDTIFDLRPMSFDDLGFKQCIENYIGNLKNSFRNLEIIYEIDDIDFEEKNLYLMTIYRVIQEALMNSIKHSDADKLELFIKKVNKNYIISISDNGKGFSVEEVINNNDKHFGISIMYERISLLNGKMKIDSNAGFGTKIEIIIPEP